MITIDTTHKKDGKPIAKALVPCEKCGGFHTVEVPLHIAKLPNVHMYIMSNVVCDAQEKK